MKRMLLTLLALLVFTALPISAQTFAGLSWEGNPGFVIGGKLIDISEKLSTYGYGRLSVDSASYENGLKTSHAAAVKLTYHLIDKPTWDFRLIGGASCDWANASLQRTLTTYITESVGGVATVRAPFLEKIPILNEILKEEPGVWFQGEWRPQIGKESRWPDRFILGIGLYSGIG